MKIEPSAPIRKSVKPRSFLTRLMTPLKMPRSTESMNATRERTSRGPLP
jgi:hypothetical protein